MVDDMTFWCWSSLRRSVFYERLSAVILVQSHTCHFKAKAKPLGLVSCDGRLSDDVFDARMPSFSSVSDPIAWVNNARQERRRISFPSRWPNVVTQWVDSLFNTPWGVVPEGLMKAKHPLVARHQAGT